jgi:hypothetical protein
MYAQATRLARCECAELTKLAHEPDRYMAMRFASHCFMHTVTCRPSVQVPKAVRTVNWPNSFTPYSPQIRSSPLARQQACIARTRTGSCLQTVLPRAGLGLRVNLEYGCRPTIPFHVFESKRALTRKKHYGRQPLADEELCLYAAQLAQLRGGAM